MQRCKCRGVKVVQRCRGAEGQRCRCKSADVLRCLVRGAELLVNKRCRVQRCKGADAEKCGEEVQRGAC